MNALFFAFFLVAVGWLPVLLVQFSRPAAHEYMALGLLMPMLWLAGCSLVGVACAVYTLEHAETANRPMAVPLVAALANLLGLFVPLWHFF